MPPGWPTWESSPVAEAREFDVVIIGAGIAGEAFLVFNQSSFQDIAELLKYEGDLKTARAKLPELVK